MFSIQVKESGKSETGTQEMLKVSEERRSKLCLSRRRRHLAEGRLQVRGDGAGAAVGKIEGAVSKGIF